MLVFSEAGKPENPEKNSRTKARTNNKLSPHMTPGARFWKVPKSLPSRCKISNLMITELLYSHIINTNRRSLHTRSFRRIYLSVFRYRLIENGFSGPKSFQGFRETGPQEASALTTAPTTAQPCFPLFTS